MLLRIETTSNSQYKFTLISAFCKGKSESNSTKLYTTKSKYTILIRVNVSNIGTILLLFFYKYCANISKYMHSYYRINKKGRMNRPLSKICIASLLAFHP